MGVGILTEFLSWRAAIAVIGAIGLAATIGFVALVPASRNFAPRTGFDPRYHIGAWHRHIRHEALAMLFAIGFLGMGAFVTIYNYAGFRLLAPPFSLSPSELGFVFLAYLTGIAASSAAGSLADRAGRLPVLVGGLLVAMAGVVVTLSASLGGVILGIVTLTIGFFAAPAVASGWVGLLATDTKGHASSLYLLAYYLGSSVAGSAGGWFWARGGWGWVAGFTLVLLALALAAAARRQVTVARTA